jgi:hypothetical protein
MLAAYARVIRARMRLSTSCSSPAARASMPCTNPTDGAAPVIDSNNRMHRCAGKKCATIKNRLSRHECGCPASING